MTRDLKRMGFFRRALLAKLGISLREEYTTSQSSLDWRGRSIDLIGDSCD